MKRFILVGAIIGFALPAGFAAVWLLSFLGEHRYVFGDEVLFLWPSSIMLMATEASRSTISALAIWGVAISVNVALYSLFGLMAYAIFTLLRRYFDA